MLDSSPNLASIMGGHPDLLRLIVERCPTALYVYAFATDKNILVNERLAQILGYPAEWARQNHDRFLDRLVHPDDADHLPNSPQLFNPLGDGQIIERAVRLHHTSGEWRWYHISEVMLTRSADGLPSYILGTVEDIHAAKTAEINLAQHESQLSSLMENTPDYVSRFDKDFRIIYANNSLKRDLGLDPQRLLNKSVRDVLGASHRFLNLIEQSVRGVFETSTNRDIELSYENPLRVIHIRLVPEFDSAGNVATVLGVGRDLTARLLREQQTFEAEQSRRLHEFIVNTSRDVRNPLSILMTSTYLLKRLADKLMQDARKMAEMSGDFKLDTLRLLGQLGQTAMRMDDRAASMLMSVEELHAMFDSMMQMVTLDEAKAYHFAPHNLNKLVRNVVATLLPLADAKGLTLQFELGQDVPDSQMDWDMLMRAVHQIGKNIIDYTGSGGVFFQTYRRDQQVVIEIKDTGGGINPDELPHIFEQSAGAQPAHESDTGIIGLGLAIVRKIIEMHHGQIEVESNLKVGSLYRILLPLES